jgi:DHA1 family bicyclomycin/chloramphenicol resistance-like MFS transporter
MQELNRNLLIITGFVIFIIGCLISIFSNRFEAMVVGRLIQGIGTGGPRTATMALVRDQYGGRAMARIMSVVMAIFIVVPAIAPALGQAVLLTMGWRAIFSVLMIQGIWYDRSSKRNRLFYLPSFLPYFWIASITLTLY